MKTFARPIAALALATALTGLGAAAWAQSQSAAPADTKQTMPMMQMPAGATATESAQAYMAAMNKLFEEMSAMQMTGDPDMDFAMMMIPHHQSAIAMAEELLKSGKDENLKKMAEKMKADQEKEVGELQKWLEAHGKK